MLRKISNTDLIAKEAKYHRFCRTDYQTRARKTPKGLLDGKNVETDEKEKSSWHIERKVYSQAFESIGDFIKVNIVSNKEVHFLKNIQTLYQSSIHEMGGKNFQDSNPSSQKMESKIKKRFGDAIRIEKGLTKQGNIIFSNQLTISEAFSKEKSMAKSLDIQLRDLAFNLRELILSSETTPLSDDLTVDSVCQGTTEIPDKLKTFFQYLIGGPVSRRWSSDQKQQRIKSICQDVIFSASSGRKVPSKHLMFGVAIKSLTGSKKCVDMLNRYGHCVNYHAVEEIETELTFENAIKMKRHIGWIYQINMT